MKTQFTQKTNTNGQVEFDFMAKLISVSDDTRELQNAKRTEYRVATIEFTPPNAQEPVQRSAIMFENNYKYGVNVGNYYLSTMTPITDENGNPVIGDDGKQKISLKVSHLQQAVRATTDDFASLLATVKPAVKAGQVA